MVEQATDNDIEVVTASPLAARTSTEQLPAPSDETHEVIVTSRPHFRNRMTLCLLAVGLNWGTSLRVANYFALSVIETPPLDLVLDSCRAAYNTTGEERKRYSTCVEDNLQQCDERLDRSIQREDQRVMLISKQNEDTLASLVEVATSCSEAYTTLRLALEGWTANGGEIPLQPINGSMCSIEDQEVFNRTMLGTQNIIALQTEAIGIADAYGEESSLTVQRLAEYAVERAQYDVNYVDEKSQQIQDIVTNVVNSVKVPPVSIDDLYGDLQNAMVDLIACLSLDVNARMTDGSKCAPNLAEKIDQFANDAMWKVDVLTQALYDYRDKMVQYKQNVQSAYQVAAAFYNGVNNVVVKFLLSTFFTGNWFSVSLADMTPVDVEFPDVDQIIGSIGSFQSILGIWNSVIPTIGTSFFGKVETIRDGIAARFDYMIVRIQSAYSGAIQLVPFLIPDDYNPPNYEGTSEQATSPEEELSLFQDKRDAFMTDSRDALGLFSGTGTQYNQSEVDVSIPPINITDIKSKVTTVNLNFESLVDPDIDFDLWFLQFSTLLDKMVFLDYIFRAYITVRLILKFWFATNLATPQVDIRVNKDIKNPFRMHPARAIVAFLTSPVGGFMMFTAAGTWLAIIISALYIPLFQSYMDGCIDTNGNGTFITKNLFSLSYNNAYQEGSGLLLNGLDAFDVKRGDTCSSRYAASITTQNSINSNYTAYSDFQKELSDNMGLSQRCIDAAALDTFFLEACCGYPNYPICSDGAPPSIIACPVDDRREIQTLTIQMPYELPGIALQEPACSISEEGYDWEINDAIFDCEELATCEMTCNEPRREMLNSATEKCGCAIEWFLHSEWLGNGLAFFLYFFMNVTRLFFVAGLTRLLWKYIYPERFTVLVTCDSTGGLVTTSRETFAPHDDLIKAIQVKSFSSRIKGGDGEEDRYLSKDLRAKLARSLYNYYITGAVFIAISFFACGVWVYVIVIVSQSLTPRVFR